MMCVRASVCPSRSKVCTLFAREDSAGIRTGTGIPRAKPDPYVRYVWSRRAKPDQTTVPLASAFIPPVYDYADYVVRARIMDPSRSFGGVRFGGDRRRA